MRCRILHESRGRMRVHFVQSRMTPEQADLTQAWLETHKIITKARTDERTCNAVIWYRPDAREQLLSLLASFCYAEAAEQTTVPAHTTRVLTRNFEDRMFFHIAGRGITRFLLPFPLRTVITAAKAVPYLAKALKSIFSGKIEPNSLIFTSGSPKRKNIEMFPIMFME